MKTYLVILKDKSTAWLDEGLLKRHVEHLQQLTRHHQLLVCGPFADDSGAVLMLQADDQAGVEALVQADPFIQEAYYAGYTIKEFYQADASNHYLMDHDQTIHELNKS